MEIWADDWSLVQLYRFGTGTAEFMICRNCGLYIGAIGETTEERFARRAANWTPAIIHR